MDITELGKAGMRPARAGTAVRPDGTSLLGLPGGDDRLMSILATAAPFPDRASGEHFAPASNVSRQLISQRSARWLRAAVGDDDTAVRALFMHRQRTGRDLGAGLLDVEVRDPRNLPDWANALVQFLLAQPPTQAEDSATGLVGGPIAAFRRAAARLVEADGGQLRGVAISQAGAADVTAQLVSRLTQACQASFDFETRIRVPDAHPHAWCYSTEFDVSRSGWLDRLHSLPGLAYIIGVICLQWQRAVCELFDRLAADLPLLRRSLWHWADPGALTGYSGDSGDLHDHGRVVVLLTFAGGQRLVYKPKDLRSAACFMDLLMFLNHHGLELALPVRQIIVREGYGWEEFVAAEPCSDPGGARRYYTRLGMLARLAELLECRDLWADNLLAIGDGPAFIDLENLLQGRIRKPIMLGDRIRALWAQVEESVVKTACISYPRLIGLGVQAQDIGCLAAVQEQIAELPGSLDGWEVPPYRPTFAGKLADPREHAEDVILGYRQMQECLAVNQALLADPRGPLMVLYGAPVRYIWRSTFDCLEMLRASVSPLALVDGIAREIVLAQTMRTAREMLREDAARADVLEIVEAEIDAFRRMDVPLFTSETTSDAAFTSDGTKIPDHFDDTAWERLQRRLGELREFPLEEHQAVLESCLDIASGAALLWRTSPDDPDGAPAPEPDHGLYVYHPSALSADLPCERLTDHARDIADTILAAAVPVGGDRKGRLGLVSYPAHGLVQLEPLHGDLLCGSAGLAIFLAELYQSTAAPAYWNALHDALDSAVEFTSLAHRSGMFKRLSGGLAPIGGFVGVGSVIYALSRCGHLLAQPALTRRAETLISLADEIVAGDTTSADVVLGRAGLLLGVQRLREAAAAPVAEADVLAAHLHETLITELAGWSAPQSVGPAPPVTPAGQLVPAYPASLSVLAGLPNGIDGIVHALARSAVALGRLDGDRPLLEQHTFGMASAGSVAAAMATAHHLGKPVPEEAACRIVTRCQHTWQHSCEELIVDADLALWADTFAAVPGPGDRGGRALALRLARALLARHERTGKWFGDRRAADRHNLSALNGLAAAGLLFLRLAEAEATSPRLLL